MTVKPIRSWCGGVTWRWSRVMTLGPINHAVTCGATRHVAGLPYCKIEASEIVPKHTDIYKETCDIHLKVYRVAQ